MSSHTVTKRPSMRFSNSIATATFSSRTDHTTCGPADGKLIGRDCMSLMFLSLIVDVAPPFVEVHIRLLKEEAALLSCAHRGPR